MFDFCADTSPWIAAGLFFIEGLGAPFPVEAPLCVVGARVQGGLSSFWPMVLMLWVTTFVGNSVGYLLGYWGGYPAIHKLAAWFRVRPERLDQIEGWFRAHGLWLTMATRWINWGFPQAVWLCGISRVRIRLFVPLMALNDLIWAVAWTHMAVAFVRNWPQLYRFAWRIGAIGIAVGIPVWLCVLWWQRRAGQRAPQGVG